MNKRLLTFNIIYYVTTALFIKLGRDDASSSLGYGISVVSFWVFSAILLASFLIKGIFQARSILDKIGVFTATPILPIVTIWLMVGIKEDIASEWYFNKGDYRYKVRTVNYKGTSDIKRIEFYRSRPFSGSENAWVRDSTWTYFSEAGDTIKTECYRNGIKIEEP